VEAKNERIEARLKTPETAPAPDMRNASGAGKRTVKQQPRVSEVDEFDNMKAIPGSGPASRRLF
jgi:hypothetical protein